MLWNEDIVVVLISDTDLYIRIYDGMMKQIKHVYMRTCPTKFLSLFVESCDKNIVLYRYGVSHDYIKISVADGKYTNCTYINENFNISGDGKITPNFIHDLRDNKRNKNISLRINNSDTSVSLYNELIIVKLNETIT